MDYIKILKQITPKKLIVILKELWFLYGKLEERRYLKKNNDPYLPPIALRVRVSGLNNIKEFLTAGQRAADDLRRVLKNLGRDIYTFNNILDFGCGCGRVLRWFHDHPNSCNFYGTDIDVPAINWCKKTLKFAKFSVNKYQPPMEYHSDKFDLIYATSVFTHLNEDHQFKWLNELKRIISKKGILLLTVHGKSIWSKFPENVVEKIEKKGILSGQYIYNFLWTGIFPETYSDTYHTKDYIFEKWTKYFTIIDYIEKGVLNYQDLVVLKKD
jgi:cyclopropane fatty-acyl-phospholipid synthase-like methyltransferase